MRVAVTGGSGLVGRHLVAHLTSDHSVINLDIAGPEKDRSEYVPCDILDLADLTLALDGVDAVVHAAGIPGPTHGTEVELTETNVEGTRNIALACATLGIGRIVLISSESVLGFVFSGGSVTPHFFPVDESHPLAPGDPYGRSKLLAETALARHGGADAVAVALRPPWVWVPEEYENCRELTRSPDEWSDGLWAYVSGEDLARAVSAALAASVSPGFHAAYVAAPDNGTRTPTSELLEKYYPDVELKGKLGEYAGLISSERLHALTGFRPGMSWREFL